jgi:hypothetical protein
MAINKKDKGGGHGGRSGGKLATPGKPASQGGQGGRAYTNQVMRPAMNKHFGHGKSKVRNVRSKVRTHGGGSSHFRGGRSWDHNTLMLAERSPGMALDASYQPRTPEEMNHFPHFLPPLASFHAASLDINNWVELPNPPHLVLKYANVPCLLTGVWPEGHRGKVATGDAYTHIPLIDPLYAVVDEYTGQGQSQTADCDRIAIPPGQTNNLWFPVFSFQAAIPGIGRKRVVLLDRVKSQSWPGIE